LGNSGTSLFPNGIAVLAGGNINATVAGNFNVSFNVVTGAYIFTQTLAISDTTKKQIVLNTLVKNDLKFSDQVRNVQVYSMDGRVINSYENVSTINLSTLSNGEYILKIKTKDNEMFSQKIIKN
jgi:phosphatidate phosphatase APP1